MKSSLLSFLLIASVSFFTSNIVSAQKQKVTKTDAGIQFIENDWSLALKNAKDQNKLVFLDIYATWCGPCKMLKQYTFSDKGIGDFFNNNFINVSIDGEKGVGPQLAQQYSIEGYPTLIVADSTGKPVLVTAGYLPTDVLMQFANEALKRNKQQAK
jgi:thioredoxin 1